MSYSEQTQKIIDKIEVTAKEVQPDLHFFSSGQKKHFEDFFEILITKTGSIFLDKKLTEFQKVKEAILFRKQLLFNSENKEGLENFPCIYICQTQETIDKLSKIMSAPKEETVIFKVQKPKHKLERVILPKSVKDDILLSLTLIENQKRIYDDWGFSEVDSKPKLILNFYGQPGTGKTMVSHAIAHELGKTILCVNYAEVESKYVGDAPKNLFKAFETANKEKAVLFFDEADSFLGKRIENVSNSSDQAVNSLRSQMLILLEEFDGVVIFATNLVKNYDKAFESRILKHIHFELPDLENRRDIIKLTIPAKVPFSEDIDKEELYKELSELSEGFSGREIKNAVLESLSMAARSTESFISKDFFVQGFETMKQKLQKLADERNQKTISQEFKEKIEAKIKANLAETNNSSKSKKRIKKNNQLKK